ncbi:MAG TPA: asparaginase [Acidimicrobiales bacterium]|nr:asparaginase [Acidimicrobiales bacterium]
MLYRRWRGDEPESQHRGSWVLVDAHGEVLAGKGVHEHPVFARSSLKSIQAVPLVESGAADRFGIDDVELTLAMSSHNGDPFQTDPIGRMLRRLGLDVADLRCGAPPSAATALQNPCSGKHAAFLALALHLGDDPSAYLDPESASQQRVRLAVAELCEVDASTLVGAVDGCGAPAYALPLERLATGVARLTTPDGLAPARGAACRRLTAAAAAHPGLLSHGETRMDARLLELTAGRLFPKSGAEGVQIVGVVGGGQALAVKVDDGDPRAVPRITLALLVHLGLLTADDRSGLSPLGDTLIHNIAGRQVGRHEVLV